MLLWDKDLVKPDGGRILLVVLDGLGGLPGPRGKSELETARTPNLDRLAKQSVLGRLVPVEEGVTPGSGPAHLALFGYDPVNLEIGRGVLEAAGTGFSLKAGDVAARGNFCTLDEGGRITDRRAGRIPTPESALLVERLRKKLKPINDIDIHIRPGEGHRFVVVFRGGGLGPLVSDTDPQITGRTPFRPQGSDLPSRRTAEVAFKFVKWVATQLNGEEKANGVLLRGFSSLPEIEPFGERFWLRPLSVAAYPMYIGLTGLLGFDVYREADSFEEELEVVRKRFNDYDFTFLHYKETDRYGEDGDFEGKVAAIERFDGFLPRLLKLKPDVLAITSDHSTPAVYRAHTWHPVPLLINAPTAGFPTASRFNERTALEGYLGKVPSGKLINLLLAAAGRLKKYGA